MWYLCNEFVNPTVQHYLMIFFSIYTTALVNLLGIANWSPEITYACVCFSLLWLILWKYWDLVVVVKQSLCIGRSNRLWDYRQELCTIERGRYWALCEGGQTLQQVIKRDCGIFIPGNSQLHVQPAVASLPGGWSGWSPGLLIRWQCDLHVV